MTVARSCSRSRPASEHRFPSWLARAPCLVAESLRAVRDPLAAWLTPPAPAAPEAVAAALARATLPPAARTEPPAWLRSDQRLSFRRALAAVQRFGGALLADGVGTGKTYIALAVALALEPRRSVYVLAPASLIPQWRKAARHTGVPVQVHSHETLSRGRLPGAEAGAVIVDESHRFRTASTRRYQTLAPWCVGRCGLLVSATPAVNRLADVARQLLLFVRDDALGWSGVPSLLTSLDQGAPAALAHLVVTGEDRSRLLPERVTRDLCPEEPAGSRFWPIQRGISSLRLSEDPVIAGLIRTVLFQALASSPAAVAQALGKYRALLLSARDAAAAGRLIARHAIHRLAGAGGDQLVLWPLVAEAGALPDLAISDLDAVTELVALCHEWCAARDEKRAALAAVAGDGKPLLVFTTHTATVRHLRAGLGVPRVAWCTGSAAGVDQTALPRDVVLDWFRRGALPTDAVQPRPRVLVATDVAAEGLDLPLVDRVVHYDLPWTAVRLDQRSGRALRLGSTRKAVEVIRFRPPPALEAAIRKEAILDSKAALPSILGLGAERDAPWRLRAIVAAAWDGIAASGGTAVCSGSVAAVVAGLRLGTGDAPREIVVARTDAGWTDDPGTVAAVLECARGSTHRPGTDPARIRAAMRGLSSLLRAALRAAHGAGLPTAPAAPLVRVALRRLMALARRAAQERKTARLGALAGGIAFLRRGHTAGESRRAESWASLPEPILLAELHRLPPPEAAHPLHGVELFGLLLIETATRRPR